MWHNDDWSPHGKLNAIEKVQIEQSDIVTFHVYDWPEVFERRIEQLRAYGRPHRSCTEYLARGAGSTFDTLAAASRASTTWG